jgi:dethiobiotin synthetase
MPRPEVVVVVVGTATEVGKTFVAAALLRGLRAEGVAVAARKPVQSFAPGDPSTDADVLAEASGDEPGAVCPRESSFPVPMAPPMAAELLGRPPFTVADLAAAVWWPEGVAVGVVETAGGTRSPIADDGDSAALTRAVGPDLVLLVADAGLGTINAVRSSVHALTGLPSVVLLNRFDPADDLHRRNRTWLDLRDGYEVVTSIDAVADRVRALSTALPRST